MPLAANGGPESRRGHYCAPLADAVASQAAGAKAVFVRSYERGEDESRLPAGLASTAFVYDNALAVIPLVASEAVTHPTPFPTALSSPPHTAPIFPNAPLCN